MTDPIFYLSMILGLSGVYVLISSFSDDDDDSDDDGKRYIYNLKYVKVGKQLFITSIDQVQYWIVYGKPNYPNLTECIAWVEEKLKRY